MGIKVPLNERAKYVYLLQLCREQIRIARDGEMSALDRIMQAKQILIDSLVDPRTQLAKDPSLVTVVDQIKQAEQESQAILQARIDVVKGKLTELNQHQGARQAYRRFPTGAMRLRFPVDQYTPRFIDRAS